MAKLRLDRFLSEVDDHFLCPICSHVVNPPSECEHCQILICSGCLPTSQVCPGGDHLLSVHDISRFPKKIYESLQLRCVNADSGCTVTGGVRGILSHEADCEFTRLKCASPACEVTFIKREKGIGPGEPLVCSELCMKVWTFGEAMSQKNDLELLGELYTCIMSTKSLVEEEVKSSLKPALEELSALERDNQAFEKLSDGIKQELEERRHKHHIGKWNSRQWTCCLSDQILSIGCREL